MSERATRSSRHRYAEHIGAPWWIWALLLVLTASLGIAYGGYVDPYLALLVFGAATGLGVWWLLTSRALVAVDDEVFVAGRARLPLEHVGEVTPLDAAATRRLGGVDADARAYLCTGGSTSTAVRVDVDDDADPTPYWLVSTARPEHLLDVLLAARAARVTAPTGEATGDESI